MELDSATTLPALSSLRSLSQSAAPPPPTSQSSSPALPPSPTHPSPPAPPSRTSSPSSSGPPSPHDASRPTTPTPSRTVKHWPWRPNVYARLKIQGHILPVKLAEVTSTPPPDRPFDYGGGDGHKARFWACVYIDELDYCWWAFTVAIILLDEILRHPVHEDVLAPATAETMSLVEALRALRDAVASDENYGGSRLWLPLFSGETLDEAMSRTQVCVPHGDSLLGVIHYSRNPGFFENGLNDLIFRGYSLCKRLHASSKLLYFGALPEEPMSRVKAYISSGGKAFETELKDLRFFSGILQLLMTQQGWHQYDSPTLDRALSSRLANDIVGRGAYGQVFKVPHPYWGDLAVKEPLPDQVTGQLAKSFDKETLSHMGMHGSQNILPFVALSHHLARSVVAMQWAENGSMDKFLARNPDSSRPLLLISIATALRQLHENNRLHGDLHMGNIVVSKDGGPFLCDFGLSKEVEDNYALADPDGGTVEGGVPLYMAPELYEPGARRTFASEVFAFGMIIFHAYSYTRPFVRMANNEVAQHDAAIIKAIVDGTRPTRDQITRDDFSDEMWNLVQDCWNQDPAHRPSMKQVVTRMIPVVPLRDKFQFLKRTKWIELTLLRPGDVALEDAMQLHEKSAQLRWTLSRMEHFGLKTFFMDRIDVRDAILMATARAMLSGPGALMDMRDMMKRTDDLRVMLRLYEVTENSAPRSNSPD